MYGKSVVGGRPKPVYKLIDDHQKAIADYYFLKAEVRTRSRKATGYFCPGSKQRQLARPRAQWADEKRIIINPSFE